VDDPTLRPSVNTEAAVYELAQRPERTDPMTAVSHLTEAIVRFLGSIGKVAKIEVVRPIENFIKL
jgi:hypothetical protein